MNRQLIYLLLVVTLTASSCNRNIPTPQYTVDFSRAINQSPNEHQFDNIIDLREYLNKLELGQMKPKELRDQYIALKVSVKGELIYQLVFDEVLLRATRKLYAKYSVYFYPNDPKALKAKINIECPSLETYQLEMRTDKQKIKHLLIAQFNGTWCEMTDNMICLLNPHSSSFTVELVPNT